MEKIYKQTCIVYDSETDSPQGLIEICFDIVDSSSRNEWDDLFDELEDE